MAFWSRIKQENHKIRFLAKELNRYYTCSHTEKPFSHNLIPIAKNTHFGLESNPIFFSKIRSYAAPIQFLQKKEEKEKEKEASGVRMNEKITAQNVRLVTDEGHSVVPRHVALARARSLNLDLVQVDGNSETPVCKMYDYKKDQLLQKVKEKEHKKKLKNKGLKSGGHKEIKFSCKISEHDLQMKADMVKRLLESGHRVKCTAVVEKNPKTAKAIDSTKETREAREAREAKDAKDAKDLETLLSRFSALIEDVACKEGQAHLEKRQAFIVVRHIKFGPPKHGGKKASKTNTSESSDNDPSREDEEDTYNAVQTETHESAVFDNNDYLEEEEVVVKVPTKNERNNAASSVPKQVSENRYAKVSRVGHSQNVYEIPNQGKQPQLNVNPSPRVPNQIPTLGRHDSSPRIPNQIPNLGRQDSASSSFPNQIPNLGRHDSARPGLPNQIPNLGRQDSPRPSFPNSPNKGFGIFSAQRENIQPNEQNAPGESNRYKKVDPSARSLSQAGPMFNRGPPVNNFEPRRTSNAFPNNANDEQAEFRRR